MAGLYDRAMLLGADGYLDLLFAELDARNSQGAFHFAIGAAF
jgi:hypothetical protein